MAGLPRIRAGIGWKRALALTITGGPLFIGLGAGGFVYAPLAFGASLKPVVVALSSLLIAILFAGYRPGHLGLAGVLSICTGLGFLVFATLGFGPKLCLGAVMFIAAGLLWATFTALVARWRIDAFYGTAVVSALSGILAVPVAEHGDLLQHLVNAGHCSSAVGFVAMR